MSLPHAKSGDVIDVRPLNEKLSDAISTAIIRTDHLELIRTVLHAGRSVPEHMVDGEITIQCIEGELAVHVQTNSRILNAGEMILIQSDTPYSLTAQTNCSALMTIWRNANKKEEID